MEGRGRRCKTWRTSVHDANVFFLLVPSKQKAVDKLSLLAKGCVRGRKSMYKVQATVAMEQ